MIITLLGRLCFRDCHSGEKRLPHSYLPVTAQAEIARAWQQPPQRFMICCTARATDKNGNEHSVPSLFLSGIPAVFADSYNQQ